MFSTVAPIMTARENAGAAIQKQYYIEAIYEILRNVPKLNADCIKLLYEIKKKFYA
jgi:hypothetical protein